MSHTVQIQDIAAAVRALELQNRPVCLHSSLRSFGFVEGALSPLSKDFWTRAAR